MRRLLPILGIAGVLTLAACATTTLPAAAPASQKGEIDTTIDFGPMAHYGYDTNVKNLCHLTMYGSAAEVNYELAHKWCRLAALRGIVNSQIQYAELHRRGLGVARNDAVALEWYTKAAQQEHEYALFMLYNMHGRGIGTPKDVKKALAFLARAAATGGAMTRAELELIKEMPAAEARRPLAEAGDPEAQVDMGAYHAYGPLIERDEAQALAWIQKAVAQGFLSGKNNLADMYEKGLGVPQDYERAISLYREVAATGRAVSLYSLAQLYEAGKGLSKSTTMSYLYYRMASLGNGGTVFQGLSQTQCVRLAKSMTAAEVRALDTLAGTWKPGQPLPETVPGA